MAKISKENAEHYHWGDQCDGWHLVKGQELSVIHERMPGNTAEVRHYHERSRQFFFVLAGQAMLEVDGVRHVLGRQEGRGRSASGSQTPDEKRGSRGCGISCDLAADHKRRPHPGRLKKA